MVSSNLTPSVPLIIKRLQKQRPMHKAVAEGANDQNQHGQGSITSPNEGERLVQRPEQSHPVERPMR